MVFTDELKIYDKHGFIHYVAVNHYPNVGVSMVYNNGERIAQREYGRITTPITDDDKEWETWEESFQDLRDEINLDITLMCNEYFNHVSVN